MKKYDLHQYLTSIYMNIYYNFYKMQNKTISRKQTTLLKLIKIKISFKMSLTI